jgi:hypothetical protein
MRSTSARDAFFGLRYLCCEADPQGKSQGRDLQPNSLQQERNRFLILRMKINRYSNMAALKDKIKAAKQLTAFRDLNRHN